MPEVKVRKKIFGSTQQEKNLESIGQENEISTGEIMIA